MLNFKVKNKFTGEIYKVLHINNYYDGVQNRSVTEFVCVNSNNAITIIEANYLIYVPNNAKTTEQKEQIKG